MWHKRFVLDLLFWWVRWRARYWFFCLVQLLVQYLIRWYVAQQQCNDQFCCLNWLCHSLLMVMKCNNQDHSYTLLHTLLYTSLTLHSLKFCFSFWFPLSKQALPSQMQQIISHNGGYPSCRRRTGDGDGQGVLAVPDVRRSSVQQRLRGIKRQKSWDSEAGRPSCTQLFSVRGYVFAVRRYPRPP